jgi:hypothetical protein
MAMNTFEPPQCAECGNALPPDLCPTCASRRSMNSFSPSNWRLADARKACGSFRPVSDLLQRFPFPTITIE